MKSLRQANELNEKDREAMQKRSLDLKLSYDNAAQELSGLKS